MFNFLIIPEQISTFLQLFKNTIAFPSFLPSQATTGCNWQGLSIRGCSMPCVGGGQELPYAGQARSSTWHHCSDIIEKGLWGMENIKRRMWGGTGDKKEIHEGMWRGAFCRNQRKKCRRHMEEDIAGGYSWRHTLGRGQSMLEEAWGTAGALKDCKGGTALRYCSPLWSRLLKTMGVETKKGEEEVLNWSRACEAKRKGAILDVCVIVHIFFPQ